MSDNLKNTASAKAKSLKTSLRKANLVLRTIRGKKAENALNILAFSNKRISFSDISKHAAHTGSKMWVEPCEPIMRTIFFKPLD